METTDTDMAMTAASRPSSSSRLKPRLTARAQLLLAGVIWYAVSVALGSRGVGWIMDSSWGLALAATGVALGLLKGRFIMQGVATRAVARIQERGRDKCAGGFFSWQSWLVVLVMMAGGHALRLTPTPRPILGVLYIAIATGLLMAGRFYWKAAIVPAEQPST